MWSHTHGVASISRIDYIIGLFCKKALKKRQYSAQETCNFIDPTNRSHPHFHAPFLKRVLANTENFMCSPSATATHCNALHHTLPHTVQHTMHRTLQYTATTWGGDRANAGILNMCSPSSTATHCNELQHTLQHTLQNCTTAHTATHCNNMGWRPGKRRDPQHVLSLLICNTLQWNATHTATTWAGDPA